MVTVAVNGAAGRMGQRIVAMVVADERCELVSAIESAENPHLGEDAGEVAGVSATGVTIDTGSGGESDVLIDFSAPDACMKRAEECVKSDTALVVGTTGFAEAQEERLVSEIADSIPVLVAPNMGLGVNLLFRLAGEVASALGTDYDVEIVEAHHRRKKDAPSGTAGKLAENVCEALDLDFRDTVINGRDGFTGERSSAEIGVHAVRGGSIVGEHTVIYAGEGERIELTHRAESRDVFAQGAVRAALFLHDKAPGLYDMGDVLF
ncbi:MAG: 4-hydroxy-tetrahydrodipicolinate reductase [Planctomycetota bacterium]